MAKTVADVMKMVKENEVKFVDFRFTDTRGKEQHVSVPVSALRRRQVQRRPRLRRLVDRRLEGHRSVRHAADARPEHRQHRPVLRRADADPDLRRARPGDGKPYERDPRSLAKRAEAYLKSSGIGDAAFFGPEPEFFIFDQVQWNVDMQGCFVKVGSEEAPWSTGATFEGGNMGHRPGVKGGYFPVPPVDPSRTCARRCA
jgi:glutamine synthetase